MHTDGRNRHAGLSHASCDVPPMALMTVSPFKEGWLALAAASTKLAEEAEAKAALGRQ